MAYLICFAGRKNNFSGKCTQIGKGAKMLKNKKRRIGTFLSGSEILVSRRTLIILWQKYSLYFARVRSEKKLSKHWCRMERKWLRKEYGYRDLNWRMRTVDDNDEQRTEIWKPGIGKYLSPGIHRFRGNMNCFSLFILVAVCKRKYYCSLTPQCIAFHINGRLLGWLFQHSYNED